METVKENKMGAAPVRRLLLTVAVPVILSTAAQSLYNIVGGIFVFRLGEDAMAAITFAGPCMSILMAVGSGIAVGMNTMLPAAWGNRILNPLLGVSWTHSVGSPKSLSVPDTTGISEPLRVFLLRGCTCSYSVLFLGRISKLLQKSGISERDNRAFNSASLLIGAVPFREPPSHLDMLKRFSNYLQALSKSLSAITSYCRDVTLFLKWCEETFSERPTQLYRANVLEYHQIAGYFITAILDDSRICIQDKFTLDKSSLIMARETEKAMNILIDAQRKCKELYISAEDPSLKRLFTEKKDPGKNS